MSAPRMGEDWQGILRSLKPNWDSYRSGTITEAAIATVEKFSVVPRSNGGIQVEIHRDGFDVEIVIEPNGVISEVETERLGD